MTDDEGMGDDAGLPDDLADLPGFDEQEAEETEEMIDQVEEGTEMAASLGETVIDPEDDDLTKEDLKEQVSSDGGKVEERLIPTGNFDAQGNKKKLKVKLRHPGKKGIELVKAFMVGMRAPNADTDAARRRFWSRLVDEPAEIYHLSTEAADEFEREHEARPEFESEHGLFQDLSEVFVEHLTSECMVLCGWDGNLLQRWLDQTPSRGIQGIGGSASGSPESTDETPETSPIGP